MSTLSEEILKLSELFREGVLSEEEFRAAKDATIQRFATQSNNKNNNHNNNSVGVSHTEASGGRTTGLVAERGVFAHVDVSGFEEDAMSAPLRATAYGLLETILRNLRMFPAEPKYRRLRVTNPSLRTSLFAVPGAVLFLRSLGFVESSCADQDDAWLQLPRPLMTEWTDEALEAVAFLRTRDAAAFSRTRDFARLRRSCALELRRERSARANSLGELRAYIIQELCADDAGDGLSSSAANLETLRTVCGNALREAAEPKYKRLRLTNPAVFRAVLQQRGGLELLVDVAGAELVEESGEAFLALNSDNGLREALRLIDEAAAAVAAARAQQQHREREAAEEAMRAEVRRARQEVESQKQRKYNEQERQSDVEECEADTNAQQQQQQRRRIPVAEAVQILLGKKTESDVDE